MERKLKEKLPGGVFGNVSETRSRTMSAIKGKHTKSTERRLRMALVRARISGWKIHYAALAGKPDFFFPKENLAVFVDGCFWHGCPNCGHIPKTNTAFWAAKIDRNISRDRKNRRILRKAGLNVMRVWEHSLKNRSGEILVIKRIRRSLADQRTPRLLES